jgi:enoyl-CoA hydratase
MSALSESSRVPSRSKMGTSAATPYRSGFPGLGRAGRVPAMVDIEVHGNVLVMKINRPEARNAVNGDVAQGIEAGLDRLEEDDALWVGVLTGTREFFCAGADLKLINSGKPGEMMTPKGGFAGIVTRERTKPVIAAVEGPALAGGLEIVLSCDLLVASSESRFGIPEVKRSLVAAAGGVFRLPRRLPHNVAPSSPSPAHQCPARNGGLRHGAGLAPLEAALGLAERISANADRRAEDPCAHPGSRMPTTRRASTGRMRSCSVS